MSHRIYRPEFKDEAVIHPHGLAIETYKILPQRADRPDYDDEGAQACGREHNIRQKPYSMPSVFDMSGYSTEPEGYQAMVHTLALRYRAAVVAGWVLVTATLMGASAVSAQGVVGIVLDTESHSAVAGVEVLLRTDSGTVAASGVTDQEGRFFLAIGERGTYSLIASSLGYHTNSGSTVELKDTGMTWVEVELAPDAIEIPGLTVTQQRYVSSLARRGYYTRKRQGLGRFIEPSDFEKNMHVPIREILRRTPVFRGRGPLGGRCPTAIIVNGMQRGQDVLDSPELRARYIAGMEVYSSLAAAPPQFQGQVVIGKRACGLVVIWTDYGG